MGSDRLTLTGLVGTRRRMWRCSPPCDWTVASLRSSGAKHIAPTPLLSQHLSDLCNGTLVNKLAEIRALFKLHQDSGIVQLDQAALGLHLCAKFATQCLDGTFEVRRVVAVA